MTYQSFKTLKTKLLTFFSNEIIDCNYKTNEYTVDIYFLEYNIAVQIHDVDQEMWLVKEFAENANCMLLNVNLNKHRFDSFAEIIKIKNSLFNVLKSKLSDNDISITRLNSKIKEIYDTLLECRNLVV